MSLASTETLELAILSPLPPSSSSIFGTSTSSSPSHNQHTHASQSSTSSTPSSHTATGSSLPPVDGGFGAWSYLTAAFFVEAIVWGFPNSFGVFLEAYLDEDSSAYARQKGAGTLLPLVGPLSSGIMYLSGVVIQPVMARYPHYRRVSLVVGAFLCFASLFGASYARKVSELVALQGALYAIGGSLFYAPVILFMSEWFVTKRGFANGIIFSGTAIGGLLLPILLSKLIQTHGTVQSLRILAISVGSLLIPSLPFIKPRIPPSRARVSEPSPSGSRGSRASGRDVWMRSRTLWVLLGVNTIQGFGYFVPILWLPSFATDLKLSNTESSAVLAVLNAASCIGRTSMGLLSDHFNPWFIALCTLLFSSLSTFILWGILSHSYAGLIMFGVAYGVIAGGWTSLWTGFIRPIAKDDPFLSTTLFSYLLFSRGIGNILSTPISTSLLRSSSSLTGQNAGISKLGFGVAGGRFEWVILFVGTCFAGAAVVAAGGWVGERRGARSGGR